MRIGRSEGRAARLARRLAVGLRARVTRHSKNGLKQFNTGLRAASGEPLLRAKDPTVSIVSSQWYYPSHDFCSFLQSLPRRKLQYLRLRFYARRNDHHAPHEQAVSLRTLSLLTLRLRRSDQRANHLGLKRHLVDFAHPPLQRHCHALITEGFAPFRIHLFSWLWRSVQRRTSQFRWCYNPAL